MIVKCSNVGGGHIFNEWASLEFLNTLDPLKGLVPAIYGGDVDLELLVLEDLGDIRGRHDLGAILEGADHGLAREALLAHARKMALLHTITAGHEKEFVERRARFPAYGRPVTKDRIEDNFAWFLQMLSRFDIAYPPELKQEVEAIIARLQDPGLPRAYTRGDVCPSNVAYIDRRIRFYDFEMGAFRPVFLSAAYLRISHLACFNGNLIPTALQTQAEDVYFATLAPLIPDLDGYGADYAAAAAAMLIWMLSVYLEGENRSRHMATTRQRCFAALSLYIQHAPFMSPFSHMAEALSQLHYKLDIQWSVDEKTILAFPAFR